MKLKVKNSGDGECFHWVIFDENIAKLINYWEEFDKEIFIEDFLDLRDRLPMEQEIQDGIDSIYRQNMQTYPGSLTTYCGASYDEPYDLMVFVNPNDYVFTGTIEELKENLPKLDNKSYKFTIVVEEI